MVNIGALGNAGEVTRGGGARKRRKATRDELIIQIPLKMFQVQIHLRLQYAY